MRIILIAKIYSLSGLYGGKQTFKADNFFAASLNICRPLQYSIGMEVTRYYVRARLFGSRIGLTLKFLFEAVKMWALSQAVGADNLTFKTLS
jgi:hypothetical protein